MHENLCKYLLSFRIGEHLSCNSPLRVRDLCVKASQGSCIQDFHRKNRNENWKRSFPLIDRSPLTLCGHQGQTARFRAIIVKRISAYFEVAVHNLLAVKVFDRKQHLCEVKFGGLLRESTSIMQLIKELSAWTEVENKE